MLENATSLGFCAPIHTNNIGRNDIGLYNRKEPQLHLQSFCMDVSQRTIIIRKSCRKLLMALETLPLRLHYSLSKCHGSVYVITKFFF